MATYDELFSLGSDVALRNKIAVAVMVKANTIAALPAPTTIQLEWAKQAYEDPTSMAETIQYSVLAANKNATVAQIVGASDAAIQTNVDSAVDDIFTKVGV